MNSLPLHLIKKAVDAKLSFSGALTHAKRPKFGNNPLNFSSDNSMLLEFPGGKADSRYRLLVSFLDVDFAASDVRRKLDRCRDLLRFDLLVFCSANSFSGDQLYDLKKMGVHILRIEEANVHGSAVELIPDFVRIPGIDYTESLRLNLVTNDLTKRLRKKFHIVLADIAAEAYEDYGTFATKETMRFEEDLLRDTLDKYFTSDHRSLAIDVGCGDGRHSRVLAKYFQDVVAFDFSHRMIKTARQKDARQLPSNYGPVTYYECDVEYEEFPEEEKLSGKVDFVCASFGMPSFVEDTLGFVKRVHKWLAPHGRVLFTFYNAHSLAVGVETPWKDRGVSASIDIPRHALDVQLREDIRFSVYCQTFDDRVRDIVKTWFSTYKEVSFPHIMAILPPAIFGSDDRPNDSVRKIFSQIDRSIAIDGPGLGHYTFLLCEKSIKPNEGFSRAISALNRAKIDYEVLEHKEVVSIASVQRMLGLKPQEVVKTVVFLQMVTGRFLVTLIGGEHRISLLKLAELAGCSETDLVLAPAKEIELHFGFPVGGIAPFGYEPSVPVYVDRKLLQATGPWMYMGIGDNTRTAKMALEMFKRSIQAYTVADLE
jgi:prolyl-tRNA editing enzyme YbaK/EbsC (Cys-tRNA(Pro) deacylase)/2-polyprenyl-3-methyl-5-hydroxy-6-metoxy-1,4-benzoquinol methylase